MLHDKETPLLSGMWPGLLQEWNQQQREQHKEEGAAPTGESTNKPQIIPDLFVLGGLQVMDNLKSKAENGEPVSVVFSRCSSISFRMNNISGIRNDWDAVATAAAAAVDGSKPPVM